MPRPGWHHLGPVWLAGQLDVAPHNRLGALPIGALAERMGVDPTTLSRSLRPLAQRGLLVLVANPADKRVRAVQITAAGRAKLRESLPYWREAQAHLDHALSIEARLALNGLLEVTFAQLPRL